MGLDPASLPAHLASLDRAWELLLDELKAADVKRRAALRVYQEAFATAYVNADAAKSAESLRRQIATGATIQQAAELERWESEVRFVRDQLKALAARTDIARSLFSGVKAATT